VSIFDVESTRKLCKRFAEVERRASFCEVGVEAVQWNALPGLRPVWTGGGEAIQYERVAETVWSSASLGGGRQQSTKQTDRRRNKLYDY